MSLFHFDYQKHITPGDALKNNYVQLLKSRVPKVTFEKIVRILSEQIADKRPSESSALTFAMLATLVGYSSECPTRDSTYVWEKVFEAAGSHPKTTHLMLGALAQYCFALDDREWIAAKRYTGKMNEDEEEIYVTIYWVKPVTITLPPRPRKFTLNDLKAKWGHATA